jgi:hypothetical protein
MRTKITFFFLTIAMCFLFSACSKTITGKVEVYASSVGTDCLAGDCFSATGKITIDGKITDFSLQTPMGIFRQDFVEAHEIKIEMCSNTPPPNPMDTIGVGISTGTIDNYLDTETFSAPEGWGTTITPYNVCVSAEYTAK